MSVHVKCSKLGQGASKHLAVNNSGYNNSSVSYYPKKRTKEYSAHIYDGFCHYFPPSSLGGKCACSLLIVHTMFVISLFFSTYLLQATNTVKGVFLVFFPLIFVPIQC